MFVTIAIETCVVKHCPALFYAGVNCGPPPQLGNGSISLGLTTFNSLAGYSCDEGFVLNPPNTIRTCQADMTWSGVDPVCDSELIN